MKLSGKQNVHLKMQNSSPLANPALQAKLCILHCQHKLFSWNPVHAKDIAVPSIHEISRTG